ncbi:MAG: 2,4'-dihydroxyacetophenone dioxygenase family protein [Pseudomonadota bacterium]
MALPEVINHQDYLLTVNLKEQDTVTHPEYGYKIHPLFLDNENGTWVLYVKFPPGTLLQKHFHTGSVHFFTTKGAWNYVEYPSDVQSEGSYLYEPGGSIHTFSVAEDATEWAEGFMVVSGANINFDESGNYQDILDAGAIESMIGQFCDAMGREVPRYIKPGASADFSDK